VYKLDLYNQLPSEGDSEGAVSLDAARQVHVHAPETGYVDSGHLMLLTAWAVQ